MPFLYEVNNNIGELDLVVKDDRVLLNSDFQMENIIIHRLSTFFWTQNSATSGFNETGYIGDDYDDIQASDRSNVNIPYLVTQIIDTRDSDGMQRVIDAIQPAISDILMDYNLVFGDVSYTINGSQFLISISILSPNSSNVEIINIPYYLPIQ